MDSELRQRKPATGAPAADGTLNPGAQAGPTDETERLEYLHSMASSAPASVQPYVSMAAPVAVKVWVFAEAALPYCSLAAAKAQELYGLAKPYHPEDLLPCVLGLAMAFFGGDFPLLIATVVAFRVTGSWGAVSSAARMIKEEGDAAWAASQRDDSTDADGNGVPDVKEISPQELVKRKTLVIAKSVDPTKLQTALAAMSAGLLAVLASLKLTLARTLTLGSAMGDIATKPAVRYAAPVLKASMSPDFHKWVEPIIKYACRFVAVSVAFWLQRIISAVHSALQGGQLFSAGLCRYLNKSGIIVFDPSASNLDEMAGYAVAAAGLGWQLFFRTPMLLSLLMLPITVVEWAIRLALSFA